MGKCLILYYSEGCERKCSEKYCYHQLRYSDSQLTKKTLICRSGKCFVNAFVFIEKHEISEVPDIKGHEPFTFKHFKLVLP